MTEHAERRGDGYQPPAVWGAIWRILGWNIDRTLPSSPKYVLVVAPHTSNWDLPIGYIAKSVMGIEEVHWMGKASLFRPPFGGFMRWLGGIPVDRSHGHRLVEQMVELINHRDRMVLALTPEGTRGKTTYWKSGFYHIAVGAQVPIALGYLDYARKIAGVGHYFMPTGDIERDFEVIRAFYQDIKGRHPDRQGEIQLRPQADADEETEGAQ